MLVLRDDTGRTTGTIRRVNIGRVIIRVSAAGEITTSPTTVIRTMVNTVVHRWETDVSDVLIGVTFTTRTPVTVEPGELATTRSRN